MFCESLLDATLDGLMPRIPRHRVKPRPLLDLRSAGCGGLLQGGLLGLVRNRGLVGIARSRRGRGEECNPRNDGGSDNANRQCGEEPGHGDVFSFRCGAEL